MSVETKYYMIEYHSKTGDTWYDMMDVMAEDEYEAIDIVKQKYPDADIQNVFLQLNGKWNRDE
mgnify:CR=1 FL=1